jgi:hypothetical protein
VELTCEVWRRAVLGGICGGLDKLFEPFVVDVRGSPFGNLVSREIMSKLHRWLPLAIASTVALVPSVQGKLYDSSKGDMAPRLFVGVCAKSKRMRSRY